MLFFSKKNKIKEKLDKRNFYKKILKEKKAFAYEKKEERIQKFKRKEDIIELKKKCYYLEKNKLEKELKEKSDQFIKFMKILLSYLKFFNLDDLEIKLKNSDFIFSSKYIFFLERFEETSKKLEKEISEFEKIFSKNLKKFVKIIEENNKGNLQINSSFLKLESFFNSKEYDRFERLYRNLEFIVEKFNFEVQKKCQYISLKVNKLFEEFLEGFEKTINSDEIKNKDKRSKSILNIFKGISKNNDFKNFFEIKSIFEKDLLKIIKKNKVSSIKQKYNNFFEENFFQDFENKINFLNESANSFITKFNSFEEKSFCEENLNQMKNSVLEVFTNFSLFFKFNFKIYYKDYLFFPINFKVSKNIGKNFKKDTKKKKKFNNLYFLNNLLRVFLKEWENSDFFKSEILKETKIGIEKNLKKNEKKLNFINSIVPKKFDISDTTLLLTEPISICDEISADIETIAVFKGNAKMDLIFDFNFRFFSYMKLFVSVEEFYAHLKINFKTKNDGESILTFLDNPFLKANLTIDFKIFNFDFSISDHFSLIKDYFFTHFIFDTIVYPEFVAIPILLT